MTDAHDTLDALRRYDGGVRTDLDVQCPSCGETQEVQIPFGLELWNRKKRKA